MFANRFLIPAMPLAPPSHPPPGPITPPAVLPTFKDEIIEAVVSAVLALISPIVTVDSANIKLVICIIAPAASPTLPPNIEAIPATELRAKVAPDIFVAKLETFAIAICVALANPFCLPSRSLAVCA